MKYGQFTMGELRSRIEDKYKSLLTSEKLIYIVSKDMYFGADYGLINSNTLKDFSREELGNVLSSKFSAIRNVIELDDIIVIHDGFAEKREFYKNGEYVECVSTGKSNRYEEDEVIYGQGSWLWTRTIHPANTYVRKAEEKVKSFIPTIMEELNWDEEKAKTVLNDYYHNPIYRHSASSRKVLNTGNSVVILNFEGEDLPYKASFAMPKLEIYKLSESRQKEAIEKAHELLEKEQVRIRKFILKDTIKQLEYGELPFMYMTYRNTRCGENGHFGYWYAQYYEKDYLEVIKELGFTYKFLIFEKDYMIYSY